MTRHVLWTMIVLLALGVKPALAEGAPHVTANDLVEQASHFDGTTVTIEGEVIGDVMIRGNSGWINVSDETGDIGVWAPAEVLQQITLAGRYHHTGDRVRIAGEFRRADPELGGDLVLRAFMLEVIAPGRLVEHPIKEGRPLLALFALGAAGVMGLLRWRTRRG